MQPPFLTYYYLQVMIMDELFIRQSALLGDEAMERLRGSHVAVFGLGGVGSWCAEALCRSGVGAMTLVDQDRVSPSNRNRQLCALEDTVGESKAKVMAERLKRINPACVLYPVERQYNAENREVFFAAGFDYVVDAIDLVSCKLDLIESCLQRGIPIVSSLGTGNKLDAARLCITDLSKTEGCPFARILRKELRSRGIEHLPVVFSSEPAHECVQSEAPPPGRRSVPGSVVWVTATAGMLLCQKVVTDIAQI